MRKKRGRSLLVLAALAAGLCMALVLHMAGVLALADTQAASLVYVDDDYDLVSCLAAGHTWGTDCFSLLQSGLNAVAVGGTVYVNDGSYAEQVVVSTQNVTVRASAGQAPRIVTSDDNFDVLVKINATGVTLDSLALESPGREAPRAAGRSPPSRPRLAPPDPPGPQKGADSSPELGHPRPEPGWLGDPDPAVAGGTPPQRV